MDAPQPSAAELSLLVSFGDPGGLVGLAFRHHAFGLPDEHYGTGEFSWIHRCPRERVSRCPHSSLRLGGFA